MQMNVLVAHTHKHIHTHECVPVCVYTQPRLLGRSATFSRVANASALSVTAYGPPGLRAVSLSLSLAQHTLSLSHPLQLLSLSFPLQLSLLGLVAKYIFGQPCAL